MVVQIVPKDVFNHVFFGGGQWGAHNLVIRVNRMNFWAGAQGTEWMIFVGTFLGKSS